MDERTKKLIVEQMMETQRQFDLLKNLVIDFTPETEDDVVKPLEELEDEAIPMQEEDVVINHKPFDAPQRESPKGFPIICSSCGKKSTVPFEPKYASKVYCPECFKNRNGSR